LPSQAAKLLIAQTQPSAPRHMPAVDFRQCAIAEVGDEVLPSPTSYSACVVKGVQSEGLDKANMARSALSAFENLRSLGTPPCCSLAAPSKTALLPFPNESGNLKS